ncbi:isochorismate synthase [Bombilactobacillus thymidiniphilus]|uniref:isochorismate synthase n=1 Tax=Bombilactobacillus thymidiniphilus TaxID=2923363 RepID=A0ABY4PEI8_9LACO|nr:isochorismate synthase [Bombilactobacillus thymidiniphilus]UQS84140.1 isochorismate synthase [Bombilactobacillus thymidiniphilus]
MELKVQKLVLTEDLAVTKILNWLRQQDGPVLAWENPDQSTRLFASQIALQPMTEQITFAAVSQWLDTVRSQLQLTGASQWQDVHVVGGFLFDMQDLRLQNWGALSSGLIFIPKILLSYHANKWQLIVVSAQTVDLENLLTQIKQQSALKTAATELFAYHEVMPRKWAASVEKIVQQIQQQKVNKVVLARTAEGQLGSYCPENIWLQLQKQHPNAYHILLRAKNAALLSATPERLVKFANGQVLTGAVAGTTTKINDAKIDHKRAQALLQDPKNLGEHQLVVQGITTALQQLNLQVQHPKQPQILATANLQHLFTPIQAHGRFDPLQILAKLHPTPALGGDPKQTALTLICQEELQGRGLFGAPIGYLTLAQTGEWAVNIRSGLLKEQTLTLWAGAGIVADSDPTSELQETSNKLKSLLLAFNVKD